MEKRTLGQTGLEVTVIGFGAMTIGGMFGPVDDAVSNQALHAAIDVGINFIDTSNAYGQGHSEEVIGKFLKERSDRDGIIIGSKGGNNMATGVYDFSTEYIRGCVEGSLKRLGVDALDLYLLHNPTVDNLNAEDCFGLLDDFKAQGKIKHWGVSLNTLPECELAVSGGRPEVMQMEYNILQQGPEEAFARAKAAGVGVISRAPLRRGFLSGRFGEDHAFVEGDRRSRILSQENMRKFQGGLDRLQETAAEAGRSPAEVAIRFCVSNPNVSTVIPGIRTPEQAGQNADAGAPLSTDLVEKLRGVSLA
jgi:aryl-alcohol dehydrogenase-like predicted oxidoreductase